MQRAIISAQPESSQLDAISLNRRVQTLALDDCGDHVSTKGEVENWLKLVPFLFYALFRFVPLRAISLNH